MIVNPLPIEILVNRLENTLPFSLVRYGDGEMLCILGKDGANCDGAEYGIPGLREALARTLTEPRNYLHCIAPKVMHRGNGLTQKSVAWIEKNAPSVEWYDSETILEASLAGELKPFIQALGKVMIVGPEHLRQIPIPFKVFVQVPKINAWLQYDKILYLIKRELYQVDTVLFCSGFLSKIAIWTLYNQFGETRNLLDIGSSLDMFCGVNSRSYARKRSVEEIQQLKLANFGA